MDEFYFLMYLMKTFLSVFRCDTAVGQENIMQIIRLLFTWIGESKNSTVTGKNIIMKNHVPCACRNTESYWSCWILHRMHSTNPADIEELAQYSIHCNRFRSDHQLWDGKSKYWVQNHYYFSNGEQPPENDETTLHENSLNCIQLFVKWSHRFLFHLIMLMGTHDKIRKHRVFKKPLSHFVK